MDFNFHVMLGISTKDFVLSESETIIKKSIQIKKLQLMEVEKRT